MPVTGSPPPPEGARPIPPASPPPRTALPPPVETGPPSPEGQLPPYPYPSPTGRFGRRHWHGRHPHGGPWQRSLDDRLLGGVAGGIAKRLRVDPTLVRIAIAVATIFGGFGAAAYLGAWLLMPLEGGSESIGMRVLRDRQGIVVALAFLPALVLVLVVGDELHAGALTSAAWPVFLCAAGALLLWRNVDEDEREWLRHAAGPVVRVGTRTRTTRRLFLLRLAVGAGLVLLGVLVLAVHHTQPSIVRVLGGAVLLLAGVVVLFGPWWIRLARDLMAERQARVRAEERADMAARVHDSVLQTLALIQRSSDDPHRVVQLARGQERELRAWLFEGEVPGVVGTEVTTFVAAMRAVAAEVESAHGVVVDVVVVGDCPLDERLRGLLDAAGEATVNAAKWSGVSSVSLFAEVEPEKVSVFVRDRGRGFDVATVAPDRRGIAHSIRARMLRNGGRSEIRSAPGEGTEVELSAPRSEGR